MTASIPNFFTPVRFAEQKTFKQHFQEVVDDYFYLGGKSVFVIPGEIINDDQAVIIKNQDQSRVKQVILGAIKVISYMTVIIPLIMLVAKASFRLTHKFHIISDNECQTLMGKRASKIMKKVTFWQHFLSSYNKAIDDNQWNSIEGLSFLIGEFHTIKRALSDLLDRVEREYIEYQDKKKGLKEVISVSMNQANKSLKALERKLSKTQGKTFPQAWKMWAIPAI